MIRALLDKGASPNIFDMGITPFLLAAGVEAGGLGGGGARGGGAAPAAVNTALLDLFIAHGADVNTQVTGRLTYSMRLSRSANWPNIEGLTFRRFLWTDGDGELPSRSRRKSGYSRLVR